MSKQPEKQNSKQISKQNSKPYSKQNSKSYSKQNSAKPSKRTSTEVPKHKSLKELEKAGLALLDYLLRRFGDFMDGETERVVQDPLFPNYKFKLVKSNGKTLLFTYYQRAKKEIKQGEALDFGEPINPHKDSDSDSDSDFDSDHFEELPIPVSL